jgi:tryptophan synthase alpha chain
MSKRISVAFAKGKAFIAFFTGGDPDLACSKRYIAEAIKSGADLIEIGIPFSDPIAEGEVIQAANIRALEKNIGVAGVFEIAESVRAEFAETPLVFLTYLNPVFKYGYDAFFAKCESTGVDGIIIPDLPYGEPEQIIVKESAAKHNVSLISLIAPTSESRIKEIAKSAEGFIYVVSSTGVTGVRSEIKTDLSEIVKTIKSVTDVPAAIGFGISTPEQAKTLGAVADGVIVGSAIVKIVAEHGATADKAVADYVKSMKDSLCSLQ